VVLTKESKNSVDSSFLVSLKIGRKKTRFVVIIDAIEITGVRCLKISRHDSLEYTISQSKSVMKPYFSLVYYKCNIAAACGRKVSAKMV